jgi:flagella basal body P-ring formation protein FlgA
MIRTLVSLLTLLLASTAAADSIELRASVRLGEQDGPVRLRHVATLAGEEAEKFGDLIVADQPSAELTAEVDIETIREKLDAAGANWGKIHLTGRTVILRPRLAPGVGLPKAMAGASIGPAQSKPAAKAPLPQLASQLATERTVRGLLAGMIAEGMKVEPTRLRLEFEETDADALNHPLNGGRIEVDPVSSWKSDRIELVVRQWSGNAVTAVWPLSAKPTMLVNVPRAVRAASSHGLLSAADVATSPEWLPPSEAQLIADAAEVVGRRPTRSISKDEIIRSRDVRGESIVRKGDRVKVRKMIGACVVSMDAEALTDAAQGEVVMLSRIGLRGRRDRTSFAATVTGPGAAILADPAAAEPAP